MISWCVVNVFHIISVVFRLKINEDEAQTMALELNQRVVRLEGQLLTVSEQYTEQRKLAESLTSNLVCIHYVFQYFWKCVLIRFRINYFGCSYIYPCFPCRTLMPCCKGACKAYPRRRKTQIESALNDWPRGMWKDWKGLSYRCHYKSL